MSSQPKRGTSKKNAAGKRAEIDGELHESVLQGGMRDDILGVVLAFLGIALFVAVVVPSDAPATQAVSDALKHAFGLGAYLIPFALVVWGASWFLKTSQRTPLRPVLGVALIVLCVMSLLSLFHTAVNPDDAMTLFLDEVLVSGGGYVGSGLSWVLMAPFGRIIACIVLIALILVGLVLVGVALSAPFLFVKNYLELRARDKEEQEEYEASAHFALYEQSLDLDDEAPVPEADETLRMSPLFDDGSSDDGDGNAFSGDEDATIDLAQSDDEADATVDLNETRTDKASSKRPSAQRKGKRRPSSGSASPSTREGFVLPDMRVLRVSGRRARQAGNSELRDTASLLQKTLMEFNVPADVVGWLAGPTVTMYKVDLPSGVRLNRLVSLADDIALSLAAPGVRIAQIPNTSLVGVEIPNKTRVNVLLGDIISHAPAGPLQMAIGEDVDGEKICLDLAKMPHLLVGGTTGSGKSVALNGMIMTILMRATPAEVRMILIDPKRVEFSLYNGIPHLLVPPVTEPKEAASSLKWAVAEMERRLKLFESVGARNIGLYNEMVQSGRLDDEEHDRPDELPYIVIVIDELSDLMMVAGKDVEDSIVRISQLARAAGIHLIVATQRPSANVVTGMIKANITNRIALTVSQGLESRVIIDQAGAEKLTGHGDMLFSRPEWGKPKRIQGCYVSEAEISSVVEHLKQQAEPEYHTEILQTQLGGSGSSSGGGAGGGADDEDPLLWEAADAVVAAGLGSTSMLQRRLKVGYARAGRIMDMLEAKGIVGPSDGSRAREVLIDTVEDLEAVRAFDERDKEEL